MGTGKTTLGNALIRRMPRWRFIDLDEEIERREGMSIREIFAGRGEAAFRAIEADALRRTIADPSGESGITVVATGGGTPCAPGAMEWMNENGLTVLLQADGSRLLNRLIEGQAKRPLLHGKSPEELQQFIESEQLRRMPFYSKARVTFDSTRLENEEEIEETCRRFNEAVGSL